MTPQMTRPRILIAFQSSEGQTAKIADCIAQLLRESGTYVALRTVDMAPSPAGYDAVVLGDSIHMSRHSQALTDYVRKYAEALATLPSALFQVSIASIQSDPQHTARAQEMVDALLQETGFEPDIVGLFAGALAYTKYGWVTRRMVRAIATKEGLETDMTRDREYTDWHAVARYAHEVQALATAHGTGPVAVEKRHQTL